MADLPPRDPELVARIADDLPVGIWVAEAEAGGFVWANRAFDEILGRSPTVEVGVGEYSPEYGIRTHGGEPYPEDRLPFVRALRERRPVVVDDLAIHRPDGRRVYVHAVGKPLVDAEGRTRHVAVVFTDITREILADRARTQAEERLRQVVDAAPIALFAFDRELRFTLAEGRGVATAGRSSEFFIGKRVTEAFPDVPGMGEAYERVLRGESVTREIQIGAGRFESQITPLRDATGTIVGGIGVSIDVTVRHRMQERLLRAERMASLGTLSACIAHEINNPLMAASASLELVTERLGESAAPEVAELLRTARDAVERVQVIARGLKTFSRTEERAGDTADLHPVLESAVGLAWNQIRHRARLVRRYGPPVRVRGNEGRLAQVILNLLVNAAQSVPDGDVLHHEISVVATVDGGLVVVEVRDTGVGIPPDHLARLFEPFFTTKAVGIGTGLGLSICREIVASVGGSIVLESTVGVGTVARVALPLAVAVSRAIPSPLPSAPAPRGRVRVLLLDDDPMIRDLVTRLLSADHEVRVHEDPREAVAAIEAGERFDVIVCDVMMPDLSGMDVHDRLLAVAPDQAARMLFMTGGAFTSRARTFLAAVKNPKLDKPFTSRALQQAIAALVARQRR